MTRELIDVGDFHDGHCMSVLDAIKVHIPDDITCFSVSSYIQNEAAERPLTKKEMTALRSKIIQIYMDFNSTIKRANALSMRQLDLAKIIFIFNHILGNVRYADVRPAVGGGGRVQIEPGDFTPYASAYSALVLGQSICAGISDAIFLLCKTMGLECEKWLTPNGGHAFNKVKLADTWYKVDATLAIGAYAKAKATEFDSGHLLRMTAQPAGSSSRIVDYPRREIEQMKDLLENCVVSFDYSPTPKIHFNSVDDAVKNLIKINNGGNDKSTSDFDKVKRIVLNIENEVDSAYGCEDGLNSSVPPKITFIPSEKKITIQRVNCKIDILFHSGKYIFNTELSNDTQETFECDEQGTCSPKIVINGMEDISFPPPTDAEFEYIQEALASAIKAKDVSSINYWSPIYKRALKHRYGKKI